MTDNDIIKALECCSVGTFACGKECPYYSSKSNLKVSSCRFELMCEISDLINRQQAEFEQLTKQMEWLTGYNKNLMDGNMALSEEIIFAKSEAMKEFAERLSEKAEVDEDNHWWVSSVDINDLVKEMTEVETNQRKEDENVHY